MPDAPDPVELPATGEVVWAEDDAGALLRFSGRIDRETVRTFRRLVPPSSWPGRVSLAAVTELDAAGLELLVLLSRKPRRTGQELEVIGVPAHLQPALERAGLARRSPGNGATTTA